LNTQSRRQGADLRAVHTRLSSRDLALVASFAALIAVLGLPGGIQLFGNAVPITLQTLGVMLAGSVLGWRRGALSVLVVLVLVAAGLPIWYALLGRGEIDYEARRTSEREGPHAGGVVEA
jgi:biotin transporter BioY